MASLEDLAPNYARVVRRWPDAPSLEVAYSALKMCHQDHSYDLVEHVKSFVESTCWTIINEHGGSIQKTKPSLSDILREALSSLGIENQRGASKLDKVLSSYSDVSSALTEMRNHLGPVAHGKDGFGDTISAEHTRTFLYVGDSILGLLLAADDGVAPHLLHTRERYERFAHSNSVIDRTVSLLDVSIDAGVDGDIIVLKWSAGGREDERILNIEPSRMLFGVDRNTYFDVWQNAHRDIVEGPQVEEEDGEPGIPTGFPEIPEILRIPNLSDLYYGPMKELEPLVRETLDETLGHLSEKPGFEDGSILIAALSILEQTWGVDWRLRDNLMARTSTSLARQFRRMGYPSEDANTAADKLVASVAAGEFDPENSSES